jgi:hypothetical protein
MLLKFIWKNKWLRGAKEILKNKNNERGLDLPDIKILERLKQRALGAGTHGSIAQRRDFRKRHK